MLTAKPVRILLYRVSRIATNQRCISNTSGSLQVGDPIQQSFVARLREYRQKSEKSEFGLTDASPKEIKELNEMLAKVDRIYGAEEEDMTQFPMFQFEDPKVVIPASSLHVDYPKELKDDVEVENTL
uniref:ATP synthase-coupling factor 6, mitochondrial n=1 Tax=Schistosoma mansoni TaxID=6183 RepID=A0A3Q0KUT8_SCHMA